MDIDPQAYYSRVYNDYILVYRPIAARCIGENRYLIVDADKEDTLLEKNDLVAMCDRPSSKGVIKSVDFVYTHDGFHRYVMDGTVMPDETNFHEEIASVLHFFDHYGKNLDALWDVLSDNTGLMQAVRPIELLWVSSSYSKTRLVRYEKLVETIEQAFANSGDRLILK